MNRGVKTEASAAAARAVDALAARAPRCEECGALLEYGHYAGCPTLPAPVPVETCPTCQRIPPHHKLGCVAGVAISAGVVQVPPNPDALRRAGPKAPEEEAPPSGETSAAPALLPSSGALPADPETGEVRPAAAPVVAEALLLLPSSIDDSAHYPGTIKVGSRTRCAECEQFYPCSTAEAAERRRLTPDQVKTLAMVDVGWHIEERSPDPLNVQTFPGLVVGYVDDEERGRIFTVVRWKYGKPRFEKVAAGDVDPFTVGPFNAKSARDTYRQLAKFVGERTGTADEIEPRSLATALTLSQSVI